MDALVEREDFWAGVKRRADAAKEAFWTPARVDTLKDLHAQRMPYSAIGKRFGLTRSAIAGKVRRLGMSVATVKRVGPKPKRIYKPRVVSAKPKTRPARVALYEIFPVKDHRADLTIRTDLSCGIVGLTSDNCHWPVGVPGSEDFFFCGQPSLESRPYCGAHCRIAYNRDPSKGRPNFRSTSGKHFVGHT